MADVFYLEKPDECIITTSVQLKVCVIRQMQLYDTRETSTSGWGGGGWGEGVPGHTPYTFAN